MASLKKIAKPVEEADTKYLHDIKHLHEIISHIELVQANVKKLAYQFIENGDIDFGRRLLANGFIHDNSKFYGIEFQVLNRESKESLREMALANHVELNPHHPEYWETIEMMPPVYVAEMVCDWKARSTEMGTDIVQFLDDVATKKYEFGKSSKIYKMIMGYIKMLLEEPFK